ncbi:MAG TPA: histidine kinase [Chitinophagaceae bacterium]|nr:histidine kinase [Chitinophagaceae bacterium]
MLNRVILLVAVFFLSLLPSPAQLNADSLRSIIATEKDPAKKAANLVLLCDQLRFTNPDSMFATARQLEDLGRKYEQVSWKAQADIFTATYYSLSGRSDTALLIAERNIPLLDEEPVNKPIIIKLYALAGNSLMRLSRYKDALNMFFSCLYQAEKIRDHDAEFKAQNNIGWAYMELEQYEQAITYFRNCLQTIRTHNLPDRYGTIYNNLASCYGSVEAFDSVYKYAGRGIEIAGKYNDHAALANGYSIIGTFQALQNKHAEALSSFQQAVKIRERTGDPFFIVSDLAEIAELQSRTGNSREGILNGEKALSIAQQHNITAKLPMIYTALAHNYEQAGNFQQAAASYRILNALKDSVYKDANPKALAEIQTKYETVKKEQQIEKQQNRIRFQNFLFAGIAVLVLLAGLLGWSFYKRNRLRQEARMQSALLIQQEMATRAVLEAEENERQRIARELHDGVGQMMSVAKMNLSAIESSLAWEQPEQKKSFEKLIRLVDESCKEVRNVSHIMMPNALLKNNLAAAIHEFVEKLDNKSLQVQVYTEGLEERLDSNTELVLYRVLQECVNNTLKHAGATTLDISVIKDKEGIHATIEDNGKGFDVQDPLKQEGMGLKNIRTRIEYLKGSVEIDSTPGKGTVVVLHVPLG